MKNISFKIFLRIYTLFALRDVSLDNKPKMAIVIKKKAVVYTNSFKVNIVFEFFYFNKLLYVTDLFKLLSFRKFELIFE